MRPFPLDVYELKVSVRQQLSREDCCKACRVSRAWYEWLNPGVWHRLWPFQADHHNLARHGHHVREISVHMPFSYAIGGPERPLQLPSAISPLVPPTCQRFARDVFRHCRLVEHVDICTALDHDDLASLSTFLNDLVPTSTTVATVSARCTESIGHQLQHPCQEDWLSSSNTASVRSLTLQFSDYTAKTVVSWLLKAHTKGHFAHLQEIVLQSNAFSSEVMPVIEAALIRIAFYFQSLSSIKFVKRIRYFTQGRMVCIPRSAQGSHELDIDGDRRDSGNTVLHEPSLKALLLGPVALSTKTMVKLAGRFSNLTHFASTDELQPTTLDSLATHCRTLQQLVIGSCWKSQQAQAMFSASVANLFRVSPELCSVHITRTLDDSVGLLSSLLDHCPRVESAILPLLNDAQPQDVGRMIQELPQLKILDIGVSPDVSAEHAFGHLGQWAKSTSHAPSWMPSSFLFSQLPTFQPSVACSKTLRILRLKGIQVLTLQEALVLRLLLNALQGLHEFSISAAYIHQGIFFDDPECCEQADRINVSEMGNDTGRFQHAPQYQHQGRPSSVPLSYRSTPHPGHLIQEHQECLQVALHCPSLVEIGAHARFLVPANVWQVQRFLSGMPRLASMASFTLEHDAVVYLEQFHPSLIED